MKSENTTARRAITQRGVVPRRVTRMIPQNVPQGETFP